MLSVKNKHQKDVILGILQKDNASTYCSFEEGDCENILIDGNVSFDAMKQIVEYLEIKIRQGYWYKCIKDVFNNTGKVRLFTKDEYYLCPKDGMLITNNNEAMCWREWHHPEECFVEESPFVGLF